MNKPPSEEHAKFEGNLRHYHRAGARTQRSWDDWVDGPPSVKPGDSKSRNWLKIFGFTVGLLGISGIVIGLIVELS